MALLAGVALVATHSAAYADFIYDFTLTPTGGSTIGGSGSIDLESAIPTTANASFSADETDAVTQFTTKILGITIDIDGFVYDFMNENCCTSASFHLNGTTPVLDNLSYQEESSLPRFNIGGSSYSFQLTNQSASQNGNVVFDFTPVATPEPASAALFLAPVVLLIAARRKRKA
jgi:hypothetical protein